MREVVLEVLGGLVGGRAFSDDDQLAGGLIDSIGIVELLVALDRRLQEGDRVVIDGSRLLGSPDVLREGGPLETVGSLISYLEDITT